jgi:uncharacterized membrane protein
MARIIRIALQVVIFFLVLGAVIGIGSHTGAAEKIVLVAVIAGLVGLVTRVRRIDGPRAA